MLRVDPLFIGPTLPQMFLGRIPYSAILPLVGVSALAAFFTGQAISILVIIPAGAGVNQFCKDNPRAFDYLELWLATKLPLFSTRQDGAYLVSSLSGRSF
jgi:type IV secretory pathway VirB3-like protein